MPEIFCHIIIIMLYGMGQCSWLCWHAQPEDSSILVTEIISREFLSILKRKEAGGQVGECGCCASRRQDGFIPAGNEIM